MIHSNFSISRSKPFIAISIVLGITITISLDIYKPLFDTIFGGALWGIFVGGSLAALIDSILEWKDMKWNAVGWVIAATVYGLYLLLFYNGDPHISFSEKLYWRLFTWNLFNLLLGFLVLGTFMSVKLGNSRRG